MQRRTFIKTNGAAAAAVAVGAVSVVRAQDGDPRIRVGQIGTRHAHAAGKMATLRKFADHYEVVGIVEPDDGRWASVKDQPAYAGLARLTEAQLLASEGLRAVAVETTVAELVPTAMRCVQAGMHVHLDKPGGSSLDEFKALLTAAERKGLVIQMGYMLRYNPAVQFCRRAVKEGMLGSVFEVHAVMSKTIGDRERAGLAAFSGGAMFELGCHLIDSVVAMLGKPDKVTPFLRRTRAGRSGDTLADNCLAVLEFPGATATVRTALMEVEGQQRRQFTVCGDGGTVDIRPLEPPRMRLALPESRGAFVRGYQDVALPEPGGRYDGEFIDLAAIIRGEKSPDFDYQHDLAVQETILRASGML